MTVKMLKTIQEERYRWIEPLLKKEMTMNQLLKICPHSESSLKRWKRAFKEDGVEGLIPISTKPKTQPNETSIRIKERIIQYRKETKLCAKKIHWQLEKQGLVVPVSTIGKILKQEGLVKKYRKKKIKYRYIKAVKTDNGSVFTNYYLGTNKRSDVTVKTLHFLDEFCGRNNITHYLIDPGKPTQNGTVERSHREDQEKFYERNTFSTVSSLKRNIRIWNDYYNNLEHCGLDGKTPNEVLSIYPPYVCT